jgi:hypothetical protein
MTATQRRPGFLARLSADGEPSKEKQRAEPDMHEPAELGTWEADVEPTSEVEPSDQFLSSLTAAMRRVADDARETSLADARAAIAAKIAAMRAAATARSDDLRTRAEQDVAGIGEWSRSEVTRIEAETQRKIEQRRAQLAEQLDEHDRRSSAEIAALEAQVEEYEGELALFFAQLGEISDPDTFISAARRMPRLPTPDAETDGDPAEGVDPGAVTDEALAAGHQERLRDLGIDRNGDTDMAEGEGAPTNGTEPGAEDGVRDEAPAIESSPAVEGTPAVEPSAVPTSTRPRPSPRWGSGASGQ